MFYIYGLFEIITNIVFINFFVISVSFFIIPEGVLNAHSLYFNEIFHLLQECIKFISFIFTKFKNIRQFFPLTLPRNLLHPGNPAVKRHPRMPDKRFFPHHLQSVIKIPNNDHSYHAVCL